MRLIIVGDKILFIQCMPVIEEKLSVFVVVAVRATDKIFLLIGFLLISIG